MKINSKYYIEKSREGYIKTNLFTAVPTYYQKGDRFYDAAEKILSVCRRRKVSNSYKNIKISQILRTNDDTKEIFTDEMIAERRFELVSPSVESKKPTDGVDEFIKTLRKGTINKLLNFFSEFSFTPSFRFVNSLALAKDSSLNYVKNYFKVQDHYHTEEILEKVKSEEFRTIVEDFKKFNPTNKINTRLKLYFGEPGTGKTTKAMEESDVCVVCASDMLPDSLMQNFGFSDGKAEFTKSDVWKAMEEGKTVLLDEINMLPFESLRFLQGITDGKKEMNYKGFNIKIHDDFNIVGTFNLNVNGNVLPIPAPLVDRCYEIKEFVLSADDLIAAVS